MAEPTAESTTFAEVLRLEVKPGDTLALRCDRELSSQEHDMLQELWRETYGDEVKLLVLDGGLRLDGVIEGLPPRVAGP